MLRSEIEDLKKRLSETVERDASKSDDFLAQLSEVAGWEVLKTRIEKRINALLEPGMDKSVDLQTLGAVTMARELAIEVLRGVIRDVESTKSSLLEIKKAEQASLVKEIQEGSPETVAE